MPFEQHLAFVTILLCSRLLIFMAFYVTLQHSTVKSRLRWKIVSYRLLNRAELKKTYFPIKMTIVSKGEPSAAFQGEQTSNIDQISTFRRRLPQVCLQ